MHGKTTIQLVRCTFHCSKLNIRVRCGAPLPSMLLEITECVPGLYAEIFPRGGKFGVWTKEGAEAFVRCTPLKFSPVY